MNSRQARAAGYHALTIGYRLPHELGLLDKVLADMRRGNISHVLVGGRSCVAVWRRGRREGGAAVGSASVGSASVGSASVGGTRRAGKRKSRTRGKG